MEGTERMTWNLKHIEDLKKQGKIRDYKVYKNQKRNPQAPGRVVAKHFPKRSKEKDYIAWNLLYWCKEHSVQLQEEYKFHPDKKYRFDWAIPALMIAVEYEGIFSDKSRHTTRGGFIKDTEKYNTASGLGWRVFRFTANNYENLITELNKLI